MRGSAISTIVAAAIFATAVISATAGGPANQPVPAPGNHNESLEVGAGAKKMTRTFIVHVPPGFDGKSKVPVVFMLHGAGGSGGLIGLDSVSVTATGGFVFANGGGAGGASRRPLAGRPLRRSRAT